MKLKNKTKFLLVLGIVFVAFLLFNTNNVKAFSGDDLSATSLICEYVVKGTPTINSLDNISNTITLDMKKTSPDELTKIIYNQVSNQLNKEGITLEKDYSNEYKYGVEIYIDGFDKLKKPIDKISVSIAEYNEDNFNILAKKDIIINWTNVSTYNEADKNYVENQLKKLPKSTEYTYNISDEQREPCYMAEQEHEMGTKSVNILSTFKNITGLSFINISGTGGGIDPFNDSNECKVGVFKDGICYSEINVFYTPPTKITVPSNIEDTDTAYINYAIPKIESYLKTYYGGAYSGKVSLEKISDYWYKVTSNGEDCGEIIIKKEEGAYIGNNIYANNLPMSANIKVEQKENATMETEIKNKGYSKILGSYELTLTGIDKLKTPIDITFNVGTENDGKIVYVLHQKKNGTYENFEKKVANGKVTITVSELSPFVLGLKEETQTPSTNNNKPAQETTKPNTDNNKPTQVENKGEKDETPKTGTIDIISYVLIATTIAGIGIITLKKKLK